MNDLCHEREIKAQDLMRENEAPSCHPIQITRLRCEWKYKRKSYPRKRENGMQRSISYKTPYVLNLQYLGGVVVEETEGTVFSVTGPTNSVLCHLLFGRCHR